MKIGSFVTNSYTHSKGFKIEKLLQNSGGLAALHQSRFNVPLSRPIAGECQSDDNIDEVTS